MVLFDYSKKGEFILNSIALTVLKILGVIVIAVAAFAGHLGAEGFQERSLLFSFVFVIGSIVALSSVDLIARKLQEMVDWLNDRGGYREG